jgi:hypothetical protein
MRDGRRLDTFALFVYGARGLACRLRAPVKRLRLVSQTIGDYSSSLTRLRNKSAGIQSRGGIS